MSEHSLIYTIPAAPLPGEPFARIKVRVNGEANFDMFVDTGASKTVITPRVKEILELPTSYWQARLAGTKREDAERTVLRSIQILGFPGTLVQNLPVGVMHLPFADGALGINYLRQFKEVCYDFEAGVLRLRR